MMLSACFFVCLFVRSSVAAADKRVPYYILFREELPSNIYSCGGGLTFSAHKRTTLVLDV